MLGDVDHRAPVDAVTIERLTRWKQLEFLRIAARDLEGTDDLAAVGRNLADLATDVIEAACRLGGTLGLAVIGMGKLGGRELNYSSDVDLIFVGDGPPDELEAAARQVMDLTRHCFRVDANLRPKGRDGRLVRTIDSYEAYWDRWAEPWEFQALLKAEPVAGDRELGLRFHETSQRWLWSHPFSADDLRSLRAMKHRAEELIIRRGLDEREIKRGPGGIRDIEFTVQLLQLVHGHADSDIRSPNTLLALQEMAAAGYVDPADADQLVQAHAFLRTVEHRLQLVDEQQVHTVPDEPGAVERLARVMGYRDTASGGTRPRRCGATSAARSSPSGASTTRLLPTPAGGLRLHRWHAQPGGGGGPAGGLRVHRRPSDPGRGARADSRPQPGQPAHATDAAADAGLAVRVARSGSGPAAAAQPAGRQAAPHHAGGGVPASPPRPPSVCARCSAPAGCWATRWPTTPTWPADSPIPAGWPPPHAPRWSTAPPAPRPGGPPPPSARTRCAAGTIATASASPPGTCSATPTCRPSGGT